MRRLSLLLSASVLLVAADPAPVTVGSPAPSLKVGRWVKGQPVSGFEKGKVYVVEFWATWCGPCRQTIPHLTQMAKTFAGKATFIGANVWERGEPAVVDRQVDEFVQGMGERMGYAVARDTPDLHLAKAWMEGARQDGIPAAFIVNQEGRIAWIGHPMDGLDKALSAVVEGRHDMAAAKAEAEAKAARAAKRSALIEEYLRPIGEARKTNDFAKVLDLAGKAEAKYPEFADMVLAPKFLALLKTAPDKAKSLAAAEDAKAEPERATLARVILGEAALDPSWYALAVTFMEKELKDPEAPASYHGLLAKALHLAGRPADAVASQEKLLTLARAAKAPEARIQQYEADLRNYQDAAKGKRAAEKSAPKGL